MQINPVSGQVLSGPLEPVYVYEAPVRLWHWVMVVAMTFLAATGYLIGSPPPAIGGEPAFHYFFDKLMVNLKAGDFATANVDSWEPRTWPAAAQGAGYCEAPRGALGHWIKIKDTKIDNYQCVVPTTWNAGPRDLQNQIGAYEAALMNTPMAKPDEPLEILRTIHSFDPCLACATHVMSPEGEEITRVTVR